MSDNGLVIKKIGGPYRGNRWQVLVDGQVIVDNMKYIEIRPLILNPEARAAFLARHQQEQTNE